MSDQAKNLKPGDTAYIVDYCDKSHLPKASKVIIKGPCEDTTVGGYEADCPGSTVVEMHTCNTGCFRNRKEARRAARRVAQEEMKRNAEQISALSQRQRYVKYALEVGLI